MAAPTDDGMEIPDSAPSRRSYEGRLRPRVVVPAGLARRVAAAPDWQRGLVLLLLIIIFVLLYVVVLAGYVSFGKRGSSGAQASASYVIVGDAQPPPVGFVFTGGWQRVGGNADGGLNETSTRSYHIGARATLAFHGRAVRVYGITGPDGGTAAVTLDGRPYGTANFYTSTKKAHAVVFESPLVREGTHTLALVVEPPAAASGARGYVDVDGAAYLP